MKQAGYFGHRCVCARPGCEVARDPAPPNLTPPADGLARAPFESGGCAAGAKRRILDAGMGRILAMLLLAALAGVSGYYVRAFREQVVTKLYPGAMPGLEYFVRGQSFSELEEAKTLLQASADRFAKEMRERSGVGESRWRSGKPANDAENRQLADDFQRHLAVFKGSEHELTLLKEYLWLLCREEQPERFLDLYLPALYAHPTDGLVGLFADRALRTGRSLGRETEVLKAFQFVNSIPLDFEGKHLILAALDRARWVAHNDHRESIPATRGNPGVR
jgi:hypothetical protein